MKIVCWGKMYPPDVGGIEVITRSVADGLSAAGHEVEVVVFGGDRHERYHDGAITVHRTPVRMSLWSQPLSVDYLLTAVRVAWTADIVHIHVPNMIAVLPLMLLPRGKTVLLHWHSDYIGRGPVGFLGRILERYIARRADRIIVTSDAYASSSLPLQRWRAKLSIIPLGIKDRCQANKPGDLPQEFQSFLDGRPFGLSVGRLVPYKGFDLLVAAAKLLPQSTVVVIVGSGPSETMLRDRIVREGLNDRIFLTGAVDSKIRDALYAHAAFYVSASVTRAEAFGVTLVEAMSYGLPLVVPQIAGSGVPWVAGEAGQVFEVGDSAGLATAINRITTSPAEASEKSAIARRRFERMFTEEKMWARLNTTVEELAVAS
ncbi:glycosyltransferase [Sphingomonas sp. PB2P12]|uniref:glycosyltransferase n=1 Tax=Sphingomonas sandaracina TaxID=3096157 RepID=UPI002FCA0154